MKNFSRMLMVLILFAGMVVMTRSQQIINNPIQLAGTNNQRLAYQTSNLPAGAFWYATDTFNTYQWNGATWFLVFNNGTPTNTFTPTSTATPFLAYGQIILANQKTPTNFVCTPCVTTSSWSGVQVGIVPSATPAAVSFNPGVNGVTVTGSGTGACTISAVEAP